MPRAASHCRCSDRFVGSACGGCTSGLSHTVCLYSNRRRVNRLQRDGFRAVGDDSVPDVNDGARREQTYDELLERDEATVRAYCDSVLTQDDLRDITTRCEATSAQWSQRLAGDVVGAAAAGVSCVRDETYLMADTKKRPGTRMRLHELEKCAPVGVVDVLRSIHAEMATARDDVLDLLGIVCEQAALWIADEPIERVGTLPLAMRGLATDLAHFVLGTALCTEQDCSCSALDRLEINGASFFVVLLLIFCSRARSKEYLFSFEKRAKKLRRRLQKYYCR